MVDLSSFGSRFGTVGLGYYAHWKRVVIIFVAQLTSCILVILTVYYVIRACNISDELSANVTRERMVHYMIMLIPTVFLPYALVSNCYLVMILFIRIIREKFEFASHAHSWSFTIIIILCQLGSIYVLFLSYYYQERTKLK